MLVSILFCTLLVLFGMNKATVLQCMHYEPGPFWCFGGCDTTYYVDCATDLCSFQDIVINENTPTCQPKLMSDYIVNITYTEADSWRDTALFVAQVGMAAVAGTGPGANVLMMLGGMALDDYFGGEEPTPLTQADLTAQYNELSYCMNSAISEAVASIYNNQWKDYNNQLYNILDEMKFEVSDRETIKGKLDGLEDVVVQSYSVWQDPQSYSDYLIVGNLAPTFTIALSTVYLTSTMYLGFLYDDGECNAYNEALGDLKDTLIIYNDYITKAEAVFTNYYKPTECTPNLYIKWNQGNTGQDTNGLPSSCDGGCDGTFPVILEQFEVFRNYVVGELYESVQDMMDATESIKNPCNTDPVPLAWGNTGSIPGPDALLAYGYNGGVYVGTDIMVEDVSYSQSDEYWVIYGSNIYYCTQSPFNIALSTASMYCDEVVGKNGDEYTETVPSLVSISAHYASTVSSGVWGLDAQGIVYRLTGNLIWDSNGWQASYWQRMDLFGELEQISVGSENEIWGINNGAILRWDQGVYYSTSSWIVMSANYQIFKKVVVNFDGIVIGLDVNGIVHYYESSIFWPTMSGDTFNNIAIDKDYLYGITAAGDLASVSLNSFIPNFEFQLI